MRSITLLLAFCLFVGTSMATSQTGGPDPDQMLAAEEFLDKMNYEAAIEIYEALIVDYPEDPVLNFYLGYCYLNTSTQKNEATQYLQKAVENGSASTDDQRFANLLGKPVVLTGVPTEARYFYGKAFHINYKFKEAQEVFEDLLPDVDPKETEFIALIERSIEECQNGIALTKEEVSMTIVNLGPNINSPFTEHSPVLTADESMMYFTTKRSDGAVSNENGQFNERVFQARKSEAGEWQPATEVSGLASDGNMATISMTPDGSQLYLYREEGGHFSSDIFVSNATADGLSQPEPLPKGINTKFRETHAAISVDGSTLYFTTNRKFGARRILGIWIGGVNRGSDIYKVKRLPDGSWGDPEPLSDAVNTDYDEESPFVDAEGNLYFCSKGHNTMGGFDIFKAAVKDDGSFDAPENIGYPINTTSDDVFYVTSAGGQRSYYASSREIEGNQGRMDILEITFSDDNAMNLAAFKGVINMCDGSSTDKVRITVKNSETEEIVGVYKTRADDNSYVLLLPPNNSYSIEFAAAGYVTMSDSLTVNREDAYINSLGSKQMNEVELCTATSPNVFSVANVMFPLDVYDKFTEQSFYDNLDRFAEFLKSYPGTKIEINGYACEKGSRSYNLGLSRRRANFVKSYLVQKGVKEANIVIQAHGFDDPIAINRNADGSFREESMRFNRRVEFKIIEASGTSISIKQVEIPAQFKVSNK